MAPPESRLELRLHAEGSDEEEVAELTAQLRSELLQLDVDRVDPITTGQAPPGTRAGDLAAIGALLVGFAGQVKLLPALVDTIKGWLSRTRQPSVVKLEMDGDVLEVTGASSAQQQQLIEAWLARHAPSGGGQMADAPHDAAGT